MSFAAPTPVDDAAELTRRAWRVLEREMRSLHKPLRGPVVPVAEFLQMADESPTRVAERLAIIRQAELLFDHLYPHMPFKTDLFATAHPREFLAEARKTVRSASETVFHETMVSAFTAVCDAHSVYRLPSPYREAVAFLPFTMHCIVDAAGRRRFVVARIMSSHPRRRGFGHDFFGPGAEIVGWEGVGIQDHVVRCASRLPAGNADAQFARGTLACTIRPLAYSQPPFPEELATAEILYYPFVGSKELRGIRMPWGVAQLPGSQSFPGKTFSLSPVSAELYRCLHRLQYRDQFWHERRLKRSKNRRIVSLIPEVFDFQYRGRRERRFPVDTADLAHPRRPKARFGYLRIKKFNDAGSSLGMTDRLVNEARRILTLLDDTAPDGLVIDLRGNAGGDIEAAERMLQLLTPNRIEPLKFHFANTKAVQGIMRRLRRGEGEEALEVARHEFRRWLGDPARPPLPHGERLTAGHPLTHPEEANDIGQVYHGPVVLLIDSFTYSAAEMFAAGFQDHGIGVILGADSRTGGGGANAWDHPDLLTKLGPKPGLRLKPLPRDAAMRLAMRRCLRSDGRPIEDFGVERDVEYEPATVDDVLAGMPGMIRRAVGLLAGRPAFRVDVSHVRARRDGSVSLRARCSHVVRLRFFLDDEAAGEMDVKPGRSRRVVVAAVENVARPSTLRIEGYARASDPGPATVHAVVLREEEPELLGSDE